MTKAGPKDLPKDPEITYKPEAPITGDTISSFSTSLDSKAQRGEGYELLSLIGKGGFGEVWEARQLALNRLIAVKRRRRDHPDLSDDRSREQDQVFIEEALITAQLDHPNIMPVYDLGRDSEGRDVLAMKKVIGRTWIDTLRPEGMIFGDYLVHHLRILLAVANAVAYAHSKRIIHRDLKPAQVLVGDYGEVLVVDWGLAATCDDDGRAVHSIVGNPAGTSGYMAPEQTKLSLHELGTWTDVYLLGGILYYLLAGRCPHDNANALLAFQQAASGVITPIAQVAEGRIVPAELERLMMAALEPVAEKRIELPAFITAIEAYLSAGARHSSPGATELLEPSFTALLLVELILDHSEDAGTELIERRVEQALELSAETGTQSTKTSSRLARSCALFLAGRSEEAEAVAEGLEDPCELELIERCRVANCNKA